uniref:C2H2-type domain-containing protein n=1 Tax=viral metagenome TaxID=1070528 RepID=A0A6C0LTI3_9ZZZZ
MSESCYKCNKKFANKRNLNRHKNNCNVENKNIEYKCDECNKLFTRKDSLNKHHKLGRCKNSKKIKNNVNINTKGNLNMTSSIVNSKKSNIYNINLMVFAKDGIKNISPKDLAKILKSDSNIFESIISNVNLNPNKPEHHNVYYADTKSTYGEVYENKKWVRKKIDEILNTLLDSKIEDLNEILNDMNDFLNKKTRNKIKESIENIDYSKPGARKKLISYLKPLLYSHKDVIIKTRKLTKEQEEEYFKKEQKKAELEEELNLQYAKKHKNDNKKYKNKIISNSTDNSNNESDNKSDSDSEFDNKSDSESDSESSDDI